jgi:hypothetical protein
MKTINKQRIMFFKVELPLDLYEKGETQKKKKNCISSTQDTNIIFFKAKGVEP